MRGRIVIVILAAIASALIYIYQSYFLPRTNFSAQIMAIASLCVCYELLYKKLKPNFVKWGIALGIAFRLLLLFSFPNLSDDVYRFFWDGNLSAQGVSPFMETPAERIEGPNNQRLFEKLNSQNYFSVYPPVCQTLFYAAANMFPEEHHARVFLFKLFLLLCELGSIFIIIKLLALFGLPSENVLFYALNPLAIIEVVGNVHFEGAMIFFVLLSVYLLAKDRWLGSSLALSLAVSAKLLPLIFLPLIWKKLPFGKFAAYCTLVLVLSVLFFLPFCSAEYLPNLFQSINLYFEKFEFNASVYYVIRHIGFYTHGYNILFIVGKYLSLATVLFILVYAYFSRGVSIDKLPKQMLFALAIYFVLATIVHPWYVVPLVALSCFTRYRFAIVWSFLVFLSYFAYSNPAYMESMKLIGLEYTLVFAYLIYELVSNYNSRKLAA